MAIDGKGDWDIVNNFGATARHLSSYLKYFDAKQPAF